MRARVMLCALACALLVGESRLAEAGGKKKRSCERAAARLMKQGWKLFESGKAEAALTKYKVAYECGKDRQIDFLMAEAYDQLEKPIEALHHYQRFLDQKTPHRKSAKIALERIRILKESVGVVVLYVVPRGSQVSVDGKKLGSAPLDASVFVHPGKHRWSFSLPGHEAEIRTTEVQRGDRIDLKVTLSELPKRRR